MFGAIAQSAREDRLVATISASAEDTTFIWRDTSTNSMYKYRYQLESSTTESIEFEITGSSINHIIDFGQSGSHKLFLKHSGSGIYTQLPKIDFYNSTSANRAKLQSIDNWGNCSFNYSNDFGFMNCEDMDVLAPDAPLYYGARNSPSNYYNSLKNRWFLGCTSLKNSNHSLKNIDFSNTNTAYSFFQQTYSLDGGIDLSTYDTSKMTTLYGFFYGCPISSSVSSSVVNSHGRTYIAWDTSNVTNMSVFNAGVDQAGENYGHPTGSLYGGKIKGIGNWNTSNVTDLRQAFRGAPLTFTGTKSSSFNEDINTKEVTIGAGTSLETTYNAWDVSNIRLFGDTLTSNYNVGAFFNSKFNQPLNNWQINSSSINPYFNGMFANCKDFNQPISESVVTVGSKTYRAWDVSKVVSFRNMFYNPGHAYFVPAFNQDIGNWNVMSGSDFAGMFQYHYGYNQDLSKWNTVNAENLSSMFRGTPLRYDLSSSYQNHPERGEYIAWDTSKVTNMAYMFQHNWTTIAGPHSGFNQDINNWNTSNVTNFRATFGGTTNTSNKTGSFNQDISTKQVTIGAGTSVETTYNAWDVSSVTQFAYPGNTSNAQYNKQGIFAFNGHFNQPIGNWQLNTGSDLWTRDMFYQAFAFNQDISESIQTVGSKTYRAWDMRKSQGLTYMFYNAYNFDKDIGNWNISSSKDLRATFYRCGINQDLSKWNTMNVTDLKSTFYGSRMHNQDLSSSYQPATSNRDEYIAWDTSKVTTMETMFYNYSNPLGSQPGFIGNVNNWDTSNVTNMKGMFAGYYLTDDTASFNQDISTKQVTVGAGTSLARTYNAWDVSSVTSFGHTDTTNTFYQNNGMFASNYSFNQPIGNWQIYTGSSNVQTLGMFNYATAFNQDISSSMVTVGSKTYRAWDTQKIVNGRVMFQRATAFNKPIGNWDMTNLVRANLMFYYATSFNQDISASAQTVGPYDYNAWYMPNNTSFSGMLQNATSFNKSLSTWYVSGSTTFSSMFNNADALSDVSFATQSVTLTSSVPTYTSWDFNSSGVGLNNMFRYADNFEGVGLNTWDTSNVTTFGDAFAQTTNITTANYDKILTSWSSSLGSVGQIHFDNATYTGTPGSAPSASHVFIEDNLSITLTDGGPA